MRQITRELHRPPPKTYTVKELAQLVHSDLCYCTALMSGYLDALHLDSEMEDQLLPRVLQMVDHLERAHRKLKGLEQHYRKRLGMRTWARLRREIRLYFHLLSGILLEETHL